MPADSLHCKLTAIELNDILCDGRIDKITMPEADEIILHIRCKNCNRTCVMSANPSLPRLHLTAHAPKNNPLTAPAFLMHLRKHIGGAIIESVSSYHGERIIVFSLRAKNELGYEEKKSLVCEIMGKYANIILTDENGNISECIKHISPASSEKRPVLPRMKYTFPPKQNKIDIFDRVALKSLLDTFSGGKIDGFILAGAAGLAPSTINAIVTDTLGKVYFDSLTDEQKEKLADAFTEENLLKNTRPCITKNEDGKTDFWLHPFFGEKNCTFYNTLNEAMDAYFDTLDSARRLQEKAHIPKTTVKNAISRTEKKLKLFMARKNEASDLEHDKLCGELIISNLYRLKQGMKSFETENYYDNPPSKVTVTLLENKSPQYNAQHYFKLYAKKKKTLSMVESQIEQAKTDLDYYNSVFDSFSYTDEDGLEEIMNELYDSGLLHRPKEKRKKEKSSFCGQTAIGGCIIRWGKTNIQNDRVTKEARGNDIWLHTQKIHGSHVVISGENIPENVIVRAAEIAAYYSKARLGSNVPVDYTLRKFVSKPKNSPPGKVIYTDYKTLFVNPKSEKDI